MPPPIPQEILDEIIDAIARGQRVFCFKRRLHFRSKVLQNCSLVARAWTRRSQKHLFASVFLTPRNIDSWCRVNARNAGLLTRHVRRLVVKQNDEPGTPEFKPDTMEAARPYLNFPNLEALTLSQWHNLNTFPLSHTFGHYSVPSLRSLTIIDPTSDGEVLLGLVALFSVDELVIERAYVTDKPIAKTFSFPDCIRWRTLRILPVDPIIVGVVDLIAGLHLQCQVLDTSYELLDDPGPIMRLIQACSTTLKSMRLEQTNSGNPVLPSVHSSTLTYGL
jgi:hypothetical protein